MRAQEVVVWQLSDGKRGHERQCEGLIAALTGRLPLAHETVPVTRPGMRRFLEYLSGTMAGAAGLPGPDLIIGAGRACQWPLLAARRARGGRAIYLMRPELPRSWFDLCIIPRHDRPRAAVNVIVSDGPLNPMRPAAERDASLGLLLFGGPSAHHRWDTEDMLEQAAEVVGAAPGMTWYASDSRRSPPALADALRARTDMTFISHRDSAPEWLPGMLSRARQAWVSADSMAMIYEALSAGAEVGVLAVAAAGQDRVTSVPHDLHARGMIMTVADLRSQRPPPGARVLDEAQRCADLMLARWPDLARRASVA